MCSDAGLVTSSAGKSSAAVVCGIQSGSMWMFAKLFAVSHTVFVSGSSSSSVLRNSANCKISVSAKRA